MQNERVVFIHTAPVLLEKVSNVIRKELPELNIYHVVDESLLQDVMLANEVTRSVVRRLCCQVVLAQNAGAKLIVVTCSAVSPAVDVARRFADVPVFKIDEPMVERAVSMASKIGVLGTTKASLNSVSEFIRAKAQERGKKVDVEPAFCEGAFEALTGGNREFHDESVIKAALALARSVDVLVLAQASMSHLEQRIADVTRREVLTSLKEIVPALKEFLFEAP